MVLWEYWISSYSPPQPNDSQLSFGKMPFFDPFFQNAPRAQSFTSLRSIRYRLWDEDNGKMISFRDLKLSIGQRVP